MYWLQNTVSPRKWTIGTASSFFFVSFFVSCFSSSESSSESRLITLSSESSESLIKYISGALILLRLFSGLSYPSHDKNDTYWERKVLDRFFRWIESFDSIPDLRFIPANNFSPLPLYNLVLLIYLPWNVNWRIFFQAVKKIVHFKSKLHWNSHFTTFNGLIDTFIL